RRHQDGHIFRKGSAWYLRYYDYHFDENGNSIRLMKCRKLVDFGGEYRSKQSVRALADEILAPLNDTKASPLAVLTLAQFVEQRYLPFVKDHKRPSTYHGYLNLWKRYLKEHGATVLRDFRTVDGEHLLGDIRRQHDLSQTTMAHIKAFLSGIFRYAKRQGIINSENPIRDTVLPKCRPGGDTYAYSLEEITRMLNVLPEPAATIVATAAFTGLRSSELRGLLWENYDGKQIRVTQSVWRCHIQEPKTRASKAPVPVIAQLAQRLNVHREKAGLAGGGFVFPNTKGKPLCLNGLAHDVIRPAFAQAGLQWHGWHAFRRGLATNLHRLGVPDKTIQAILRHANVSVTQSCYIKTASEDALLAMQSLEYATSMQLERESAANIPHVQVM
ncbi:MAG: tyrosine-type recombinase/integrase, partial [Candidatus Korobacteraceae bacterium]